MQIELKFDRKQNARASRDFPEKKPRKLHTQLDTSKWINKKTSEKILKVTHQLHIIKKVKYSDLEKCMSEQHHVIAYLREDNYRQDQTIQHHMEVMETLQPTSFD